MDNIHVNTIPSFADSNACDFDKDYCNWTNVWSTSPSFKWYRHKGPTPSRNTGPGGDHGTGNGKFGLGLPVLSVQGFPLFYREMEFLNTANLRLSQHINSWYF